MVYMNDSSRVWHVAKSGNDANSGHAGQYPVNLANDAKLTIGAAKNAASSGDTIIIWPGDYEESVYLSSKSLMIIGTSRSKTRIVPSSSHGLWGLGPGCVVRNLSIEAVVGGALGINAQSVAGLTIDNCDLYGAYDAVAINQSTDVRIMNSKLQGKYDGCNFDRVSRLLVDNCVFFTDGTYGTNASSRGGYLPGAYGVIRNSIFWAERNDSSSQTCAGIDTVTGMRSANLVFDNCLFYARNGTNNTGKCAGISIDYVGDKMTFNNCVVVVPATKGSIYGVHTNKSGATALLKNCIISASASGTPTQIYDLKNAIGSIVAANCSYATASGVITQQATGWANGLAEALFTNGAANKLVVDGSGRVDASSVNDIDGDLLAKAAKMLMNKAVQNKLTGEIKYYDDDSQTVILTHTPDEDGSSFTRAVS